MNGLTNDWLQVLGGEFDKPYYQALCDQLKREYAEYKVYPNKDDIFNALHFTPFSKTKVVILGQDPYHGPGQAHGLSFSVQADVSVPPSLKNVYKELHDDLGCDIPNTGDLSHWAKQGVLLLNTVLTVRHKHPHSHKGIGWETFTDTVISKLNTREQPVVFLLWGKHAQAKKALITNHHYIIESSHPSPFSAHRGFFGSRPFSKVNHILESLGEETINWG